MNQLERRIERLEKQCDGDEGKPVIVELAGRVYEMSMGQCRQILRNVQGTRHYPEVLARESA